MITRYYKSFSEKEIYECPYVGYTLRTNSCKEYVEHRKTHDEPFIYECKEPNCGKKFIYGTSFNCHKSRKHQPNQPKC
ncbi:zinc finger protein [Loa loa]|uniref:Zinc finger protein n=1 Tax=Loa loa TaxID=7209 RepID=A0A1S0TGN0_LOALO|nr:zinc finger protein [Loa loa]EFO13495.1 zinc finger protein [Loa loa]